MALLVVLAFVFIPGCKGKGGTSERVSVSVSIFPIYDLVRRVAGSDADVTLLVSPDRNVGTFEPTPKDIEGASRARLGVMVGLGLDPWMEKLMHDAAPKARVLKVGDRVPTLTVKASPARVGEAALDPAEGDRTDPNVWLDPERARLIVRAIAEELGRADSAHALAYRKRATDLDASLATLDQEIEARAKALTRRTFVTFRGAFQYFAERYRLDVLDVSEPLPASPTSAGELIKTKNAAAVFRGPQADPAYAKQLAEAAKVPLDILDSVGGAPQTDSYEKLMRFNMASLERHLK